MFLDNLEPHLVQCLKNDCSILTNIARPIVDFLSSTDLGILLVDTVYSFTEEGINSSFALEISTYSPRFEFVSILPNIFRENDLLRTRLLTIRVSLNGIVSYSLPVHGNRDCNVEYHNGNISSFRVVPIVYEFYPRKKLRREIASLREDLRSAFSLQDVIVNENNHPI